MKTPFLPTIAMALRRAQLSSLKTKQRGCVLQFSCVSFDIDALADSSTRADSSTSKMNYMRPLALRSENISNRKLTSRRNLNSRPKLLGTKGANGERAVHAADRASRGQVFTRAAC